MSNYCPALTWTLLFYNIHSFVRWMSSQTCSHITIREWKEGKNNEKWIKGDKLILTKRVFCRLSATSTSELMTPCRTDWLTDSPFRSRSMPSRTSLMSLSRIGMIMNVRQHSSAISRMSMMCSLGSVDAPNVASASLHTFFFTYWVFR